MSLLSRLRRGVGNVRTAARNLAPQIMLAELAQRLPVVGPLFGSSEDEKRIRDRRPAAKRAAELENVTLDLGANPHADERTIRRIAEEQDGGVSSERSVQAYARGENPGGLHHKGSPASHPSLVDE